MEDKITIQQVKFHLDKMMQLEKEWESRKNAGERRIQKMEMELRQDLDRIKQQIDMHQKKAGDVKLNRTARLSQPPTPEVESRK